MNFDIFYNHFFKNCKNMLSNLKLFVDLYKKYLIFSVFCCRFPQGKRGLKYYGIKDKKFYLKSLPAREAWIEIAKMTKSNLLFYSRFPQGKRGLKSKNDIVFTAKGMSLPAREAWIEID